jgi:hypothetical protein
MQVSEEVLMTPFDVLDQISSSYWGKQMYFLQDNGMVYDRYNADYITLEMAVQRFAKMIGEEA